MMTLLWTLAIGVLIFIGIATVLSIAFAVLLCALMLRDWRGTKRDAGWPL